MPYAEPPFVWRFGIISQILGHERKKMEHCRPGYKTLAVHLGYVVQI